MLLLQKKQNIFLSLILPSNHNKCLNCIIPTLLLLFCSCSTSQKITSLLPEPDNASPLVYENTPLYHAITVKDIENQTNLLLNGLIYQDNNIDDDDIEIKVWKAHSHLHHTRQ
jgi:hypothetical protein